MADADTPGKRLYLIRLARGDGVRDAQPMRQFVRDVQAQTGKRYLASTISLMERELQPIALEDVEVFARVDPRGRGRFWLAFGDPTPDQGMQAPETPGVDERGERAG